MNILFAKCSRKDFSQFNEVHESLSLAYLCSSLRKIGCEVEILDALLLELSFEQTVRQILKNRYDLIGFTISDSTFIEPTILCIREIRKDLPTTHITI